MEKKLLLATLVFPVMRGKVLLATKMKKIGAGFLNGYGGGVEEGESISQSAVREFREETGGAEIEEKNLKCLGVAHFTNNTKDGEVFVCTVYVYKVHKWIGEIVSTEEMRDPRWFRIRKLGVQNLMPADKFWLPRMLSGVRGTAYAEYGPSQRYLVGEVRFVPFEVTDDAK